MLSLLISRSSHSSQARGSPFECGFERFSSARSPFSLKFYLVVIVFLVFDVEVLMLIPIPQALYFYEGIGVLLYGIAVVVILLIGLVLE